MFPFCFSRIIHFGRLIGFTEGIQKIRPADYVDGTTFFLLKHFNNEATNHYHSHTHTHTHAHTHRDPFALSVFFIYTYTLSLSLSLSYTHTHFHSLCLFLIHIHTHVSFLDTHTHTSILWIISLLLFLLIRNLSNDATQIDERMI